MESVECHLSGRLSEGLSAQSAYHLTRAGHGHVKSVGREGERGGEEEGIDRERERARERERGREVAGEIL